MKKVITTIFICSSFFVYADFWTQKASFPGAVNYSIVSFSIGAKGYAGCGTSTGFWEYDPATNMWTQKASYAGNPNHAKKGFSIDGKGYVGLANLGIQGSQEFWQYDTALNNWQRKADFPYYWELAVTFSDSISGYVGISNLGSGSFSLFKYDTTSNSWTQKNNLPQSADDPVGFTMDNTLYFCALSSPPNFWRYESASDSWVGLTDLPAQPRPGAAAFSIGNKGYFGTGYRSNDFWQFDPAFAQWEQKANFLGSPRGYTAFFSIGNKGYIGLGIDSGFGPQSDFYEYTPDSTTGINEFVPADNSVSIFPNPSTNKFTISCSESMIKEITIYNPTGEIVYSEHLSTKSETLNTNLSAGIYFVKAKTDSTIFTQKIIIQ